MSGRARTHHGHRMARATRVHIAAAHAHTHAHTHVSNSSSKLLPCNIGGTHHWSTGALHMQMMHAARVHTHTHMPCGASCAALCALMLRAHGKLRLRTFLDAGGTSAWRLRSSWQCSTPSTWPLLKPPGSSERGSDEHTAAALTQLGPAAAASSPHACTQLLCGTPAAAVLTAPPPPLHARSPYNTFWSVIDYLAMLVFGGDMVRVPAGARVHTSVGGGVSAVCELVGRPWVFRRRS